MFLQIFDTPKNLDRLVCIPKDANRLLLSVVWGKNNRR